MNEDSRILVVNDDPTMLYAVSYVLTSSGYEVIEAATGHDCLSLAKEARPDLILLDRVLPDIEGVEVCRRIKADLALADTVVVLFSALETSSDSQADGLEAGADGYIVQPISNRELVARVEAMLRIKRIEEALQESEERYRVVSELTSDYADALRFEPDGSLTCEWVTGAFTRITGFEPDELPARDGWKRLVHPDDLPIFERRLKTLLSGQPDVSEYRIVTTGGEVRWLRAHGRPIWDEVEGRVVRYIGAVQDITEQVHMAQALQRNAHQLEALRQIGLELSTELNLETLLRSIVVRAIKLVGGTSGGLYLYRPERDVLEWAMNVGSDLSPLGSILQRGEGLSGQVWETGQPLIVDDYQDWEGRAATYQDFPFTAVVGVPIRWGNEFLGVLNVLADPPRTFSPADAELLCLFAIQAGVAIHNARLYESERASRERAEILGRAAQSLGASLELDEVLRLILEQLRHVLAYDTASVLILREGNGPNLVVGLGYADEQMTSRESRHLLDHSPILRQMARDLQAVLSPDVRELEGWIWVPGAEHVRSWLGVPLVAQDRMIGALMVDSQRPNAFGEPDLRLAQALAQHAAQAIENARMFAEIHRRNRELALLNRIIAASAADLDATSILETACREMAHAFGVPQAGAALLNEDKSAAAVVAEYSSASSDQRLPEGRPSALGKSIPVPGNPSYQYLLTHKAPLAVEDAQHDPRLAPIHDLMRQRGVSSLLILPLLVNGEVVGSLGLDAVELRQFSAGEVSLAWSVADQVAGALSRAWLDEERRRLVAAIEQTADGVVITDTEGAMLYVNPAFERVTGYSRAEVVGQKLRIFKREDTRQDVASYDKMWETVRAGHVWQERFANNVRKDGALYTADVTVSPVRNEGGAIVNYVAAQRDVTSELQLEEQYRQAQKMEAIGQLTAGIAHDFNNLLTAINGFTELARLELGADEPAQELLDKVRDSGRRAADLVRQLLAFSRKQIIQPQVLDLNEVVTHMNRMLQRVIGEHIELKIILASDLWPVKMDPAQMEQVVVNLAVNARDAMPGGGELTIKTANVVLDEVYVASHLETQVGEYVLLAISDTGVGMSQEVKAHIFEPFFTTKGPGRGTGLGLSTVYGIVRQSGGNIWVYSEEGVGTTFKIYLPRAVEPGQPLLRSQAEREMPSGNETILLVEDAENVRDLAGRVLKAQGYTVLEAANGEEALRLAADHSGPIHLVLTDVIMPGMSGKSLAQKLSEGRPGIKILFMSGYTDEAIAQHGMLEAGVALLQKPFNRLALAHKVRQAIDAG